MLRSFETLGFLSPDIDQFRSAERARLNTEIRHVEHAVETAIADLRPVTGTAWYTPTEVMNIVTRLHDGIAAGRKNAALAKQCEEHGTPLMPDMSLQQVNVFMRQEVDRSKVMVEEAQITV